MASIRREMTIAAPPEAVWDAVRDVGNIHQRLVPGLVTDCRMEGDDARIVTFGNGMVVKEILVDAVWIADLLPDAMAPAIGAMIDQGMAAMKKTLER